jgi:hypothetical protein
MSSQSYLAYLIKVYYVANMIKQLVIFGLLFSFPLLTYSQEIPDSVILKKFVAVYMQEKKLNEELAFEFQDKVRQLEIDTSTFNEYQRHKRAGTPISLEFLLIETKINKLKSQYQVQKEKAVKDLCATNSLDYHMFLELEKRYQQEINFNRACMKYFRDYFKGEWNE